MSYNADDPDEIRDLLLGRSIIKVDDNRIYLDDGKILSVHGNAGCGGCPAGNYEITELNNQPVNAIMAVEFETAESTTPGDMWKDGDVYRIFVLAEDTRIKLLEAQGGADNGWYGAGYWITVTDG